MVACLGTYAPHNNSIPAKLCDCVFFFLPGGTMMIWRDRRRHLACEWRQKHTFWVLMSLEIRVLFFIEQVSGGFVDIGRSRKGQGERLKVDRRRTKMCSWLTKMKRTSSFIFFQINHTTTYTWSAYLAGGKNSKAKWSSSEFYQCTFVYAKYAKRVQIRPNKKRVKKR